MFKAFLICYHEGLSGLRIRLRHQSLIQAGSTYPFISNNSMNTQNKMGNPNYLPPEFDDKIYQNHIDLKKVSKKVLFEHWNTYGIKENRKASIVQARNDFFGLIPQNSSILEVGCFDNPVIPPGANVEYADFLSTNQLGTR